jgi:phytanoyl-CoA hydroxylase
MLAASQIEEFQRNGFLNGGRILDDEELEELKEELDRVLDKGLEGLAEGEKRPLLLRDLKGGEEVSANPVWQVVNIWEASTAFERLLYHPFIVVAISQLAGQPDLMIWHDQIQYKPACCGGATGWHQDAPLWPIIRPMTLVSAWIPLDDADEENGCMWMVPGSHKWGNQIDFLRTQGHLAQLEEFKDIEGFTPPAGAQNKTVEPCSWPIKKGEVSFHHSLSWHGSPFNHSERPRRAIAIHYMTGEARFVASGEHPMKEFVELEDGALMARAGEHFPQVCKDGKPVGMAPI